MALSKREQQLARLSLVAVWLGTALVSVQQAHGLSTQLLQAAPLIPAQWYALVIYGGAAIDLLLGLWMLWRPGARVYLIAMAMTLAMTLIATVVDATLWLHPLGPISKNLPIIALLWILSRHASS